MLKRFHLEADWKLVSVLRCTKDHAVLSLKNARNGAPEIVKIMSKSNFNSKIYNVLSDLEDRKLIPIKGIHSYRNWVIIHYPLLNPLKDYLCLEGMCLSEILCLIDDISEAVISLHGRKLLHLDISPDNIFLDDDGNFLLGDFSNTQWAGCKGNIDCVTPCYTAPECTSGNPSYASDQYSFAMLIFALLHKGAVYENEQEKLNTFLLKQQKKMFANGVRYPTILYTHFEKALSPAPSTRYPDIISFVTDIRSCLEPLCKESEYRMQLTNRNHPFYQVCTVESAPGQNRQFGANLFNKTEPMKKFAPLVAVSILFLLLVGNFVVRQIKRYHKNDIEPMYTENILSDSSDTKSQQDFNISDITTDQILDVSNQYADTLAELLSDDSISSDWNILYGENNFFTSLEELAEFPHIRELYLSGNKIDSLDALESLKELQTLIISDNCCSDLSPLSTLSNLAVLDLSGNYQLSYISCLRHMQNLRLLILTDTNVSPDSIQELQAAIPECEIVY